MDRITELLEYLICVYPKPLPLNMWRARATTGGLHEHKAIKLADTRSFYFHCQYVVNTDVFRQPSLGHGSSDHHSG